MSPRPNEVLQKFAAKSSGHSKSSAANEREHQHQSHLRRATIVRRCRLSQNPCFGRGYGLLLKLKRLVEPVDRGLVVGSAALRSRAHITKLF